MGVLSGLRVIEVAGLGPAPFCGMLLADMGADVLRITRPGVAVDATDFSTRNRLSLALDRWDARLRRTTLGRQLARRLSASGVRIRLSVFAGILVALELFVKPWVRFIALPALAAAIWFLTVRGSYRRRRNRRGGRGTCSRTCWCCSCR